VLLTADGHGTADIMRATGKAKTVIWRWQERFGEEGVAGLWRDKTRPSRIPPLRAEVAERVVALTLAGPPPTASHWIGAYGDRGHAGGVSHQGLPRGSAERLRGSWSVFNPSSLPGCPQQSASGSRRCVPFDTGSPLWGI
jgi:hypothetical protein